VECCHRRIRSGGGSLYSARTVRKQSREEKTMSVIEFDGDGIPFGWQDVRLTEEELDRMVDAAEADDFAAVEQIVEGAYARLYATYNQQKGQQP